MYPTPPNDINDAIQNGVSMMSKRPIEMMIMGRMVRVAVLREYSDRNLERTLYPDANPPTR